MYMLSVVLWGCLGNGQRFKLSGLCMYLSRARMEGGFGERTLGDGERDKWMNGLCCVVLFHRGCCMRCGLDLLLRFWDFEVGKW